MLPQVLISVPRVVCDVLELMKTCLMICKMSEALKYIIISWDFQGLLDHFTAIFGPITAFLCHYILQNVIVIRWDCYMYVF